ncbi:MAG: putative bifunctional diguanylate cyclase/phosphodiesterase [Solirubrobacteraceae bacterium]
MATVAPARLRRIGSRFLGRQLVIVLASLGVIVAMIAITSTASRDHEQHQRVQVLVDRIWARSEALGVLTWREVAQSLSSGQTRAIDGSSVTATGFAIYRALSADLASLRQADRSQRTIALLTDSIRLDTVGMRLLASAGDSLRALMGSQAQLAPVLDRLEQDSLADAALQQRLAGQAASRVDVAYVGSLLVGLLVLLLLGVQLYRIRRRALLIGERRSSERRAEERIRALVEHASDIISVVGPDLTVRWQSPTVQHVLGRPADALLGSRLTALAHPDDVELLETQLSAATRKPGVATFTARFLHAEGDWRHLETIAENRLADPVIEGVVLSMRDISQRKALEDELRHQAFHDALTGLANRALFENRLAHGLAGARRHGRSVAVLFLDLDDFKTVNDSLGHSSGDELLRAVAIRIARVTRTTDTAARLGGDEFAVLLDIVDDEHEPEMIADRMLQSLTPPFSVSGHELRVTASLGIARSDGSLTADELLRNADTAMYAAKEAGKGTVEVFHEGMHQRVLDRLELTSEMQRALEQQEFELDYQPIVELEHGQIIGAEALVRWLHPTRGRLAPAQFIPLAEDTGLIVPLGAWVLHATCAQAAIWQREFPERELTMNVNVSTRQLHDGAFPATVAKALQDSGIDPALLVLELTESLLLEDDAIIAQLRSLKNLGVLLAVDDFGTGYSALSRLQQYPVDILKIDRSFINGIEHDADKKQLVRGIVNLGESLRMSVVAEGIEQPGQADELRRMHSLLGQGYLFSHPILAEQLRELLQSEGPLCEFTADSRA